MPQLWVQFSLSTTCNHNKLSGHRSPININSTRGYNPEVCQVLSINPKSNLIDSFSIISWVDLVFKFFFFCRSFNQKNDSYLQLRNVFREWIDNLVTYLKSLSLFFFGKRSERTERHVATTDIRRLINQSHFSAVTGWLLFDKPKSPLTEQEEKLTLFSKCNQIK